MISSHFQGLGGSVLTEKPRGVRLRLSVGRLSGAFIVPPRGPSLPRGIDGVSFFPLQEVIQVHPGIVAVLGDEEEVQQRSYGLVLPHLPP